MMRTYTYYIIVSVFLTLASSLPAQSQPNEARDILRHTAEAFRQAKGIEASFSVRSPEGYSEGTISLKGEKFVLQAGGLITWFDGHTQWTYLPSSDEVNISEPTPEELQGINPYAWLSIYEQGYRLKKCSTSDNHVYEIELTATSPQATIARLKVQIEKTTWHPVRINLTLTGNTGATVIQVHNYRTGLSWPDQFFTFNPKTYPSAEIIDLR